MHSVLVIFNKSSASIAFNLGGKNNLGVDYIQFLAIADLKKT
ncbi:MAG: hypothetical protein V7K26_06490 [Nostoc sp.]